jgi:hypothetical protein
MSRSTRSLITFFIVAFVFWLIWSRLHFVVLVQMPWWGLLILGLVLFLVLDWVVARVVRKP